MFDDIDYFLSFPLVTRDILYRSKVIYARHFFDTKINVQLDSKYKIYYIYESYLKFML